MKINKTIAVSGDSGSFSEEAGLLYCQRENIEPEMMFALDMQGVLEAVNNDQVELGIFPVVNSRGGLVKPAFEAMGKYTFDVIGELWFEVFQCLMVLPGTKKEDIKKIATHIQAIKQCERYIKSSFPNAELIEWSDTARAAKDLAEGALEKDTAVIAPARSAHIYGLELLEKGIQDNHPNLTTFIIVKKT